jgi:hypothetical protein
VLETLKLQLGSDAFSAQYQQAPVLGVGPDTDQARWLIEKIDLASVKLRSRYKVEEGP